MATLFVALEIGLLYAILAIGVHLTYRVLDFPDLTVDGSFTTGAAVTAVMIGAGQNPWFAVAVAFVAGWAAGSVTGVLHVWAGINPLLSGIVTQIALYSINLRIMGKANLPLGRNETLFTLLREEQLMRTFASVAILAGMIAIVGVLVYLFLGTEYGVALRATGDNEDMARAQGINTGQMKVLGLALSNALVAACGSLIAQYNGYADIQMGIGLIVAGLASVIIGQAIFGMTAVWQAVLAAVLGSIIYRGIIQGALQSGMDANDMKLVSAVLVVLALTIPSLSPLKRARRQRVRRRAESMEATA